MLSRIEKQLKRRFAIGSQVSEHSIIQDFTKQVSFPGAGRGGEGARVSSWLRVQFPPLTSASYCPADRLWGSWSLSQTCSHHSSRWDWAVFLFH